MNIDITGVACLYYFFTESFKKNRIIDVFDIL
jgi:hypothetical protein